MGGYFIPNKLSDLSEEEQNKLFDWINKRLIKTKNITATHTAYGLKHLFKAEGGFYIATWVFKDAMIKLGFKAKQISAENWCFNISKKF